MGELAGSYGFTAESAGQCVKVAVAAGAEGEPFLDEIAHRLALGVASVCVILDPGLVVLAGEVGQAGGTALTARVEEAVARICPVRPEVVTTTVTDKNPGLRGPSSRPWTRPARHSSSRDRPAARAATGPPLGPRPGPPRAMTSPAQMVSSSTAAWAFARAAPYVAM